MTANLIATPDTGIEERSRFAAPSGPRFLRFGPFQVDQQRQEVTKNGSRYKLPKKVFQVLVALLDKPGEVVTREQLRQRLWPADEHVDYDANIRTAVGRLRQVLGDSTDKALYIKTIPRKGYCFLVAVEASEVPSGPPAARSGDWIPIRVVGLILAGMLLGAVITIATHYISHFVQATRWP
jgi:DNA-binding winged helix-turn-helix (wHTH) protein